jgi:Histidine phosphatase superfamily (branch 1)
MDALAEAPIEAVVRQCLPARMQTDVTLQALVAELGDGTDKPKIGGAFERVLDYVTALWVSDELGGPGIETAQQFSARVLAALDTIVAREGEGRCVAVVTSNGVIGELVAHVRRASGEYSVRPMFWNSSRTELLLRSGALSVGRSNLVDHLADEHLLTLI